MTRDDFDKDFRNMHKTVKRSMLVVGALFFAYLLAWCAVVSLIVYVAWHFVSKYW